MILDIPLQTSIKRQVASDDKNPNAPDYVLNQRQLKAGIWRRREGTEKVHPDRGNQYQYTTP